MVLASQFLVVIVVASIEILASSGEDFLTSTVVTVVTVATSTIPSIPVTVLARAVVSLSILLLEMVCSTILLEVGSILVQVEGSLVGSLTLVEV